MNSWRWVSQKTCHVNSVYTFIFVASGPLYESLFMSVPTRITNITLYCVVYVDVVGVV